MAPRNENDPRSTTKLRLIELHYEERAEDFRWNAERFRRLAEALQMTVYELGAYIRMSIGDTEAALRRDKFNRQAELHLALISRTLYPDSRPRIFPPC